MESYYEINVAKDGRHFFATAPRSLPDTRPGRMMEVLAVFREKFPESDGYEISVSRWEIVGHSVTVNG